MGTAGTISSTQRDDEPHVEQVSYTLTDLHDPHIAVAGRLVGGPGPSRGLYIVKTADPDTHDATENRYPGSRGFFMQDETTVAADGCWEYPLSRLAYPCAGGVEFWFHFMLIPDATAQSLQDMREDNPDGVPPEAFLGDPDVEDLGRLDVRTLVDPTCPGA